MIDHDMDDGPDPQVRDIGQMTKTRGSAYNINVPDMVGMTGGLPPPAALPGLRSMLQGFVTELETSGQMTEDRLAQIVEQVRAIPAAAISVGAIEHHLKHPTMVATLCSSLLKLWTQSDQSVPKMTATSIGGTTPVYSDEEQAVWDMLYKS